MGVKPKVYFTNPIHREAMELIGSFCEIDVHGGEGNASSAEVLERVSGKDGMICLIANAIDKDVMDAGASLRAIVTASAGYNHIDIAEATRRGIYVCNVPSGPTEATADLAFALLMGVARRIVEADLYLREGRWEFLSPMMFLGSSLAEKTLGIVGFGQIGRALAKRTKGFNMHILYTDIARVSPEVEADLNAQYRSLEDLLKEADFISLHTPVTDATYHMINEERLQLMKPTAILINTSRGAMIDESALTDALKRGQIAGAGLDVFEVEPIDRMNPLIGLSNVILLPHLGSSTVETRLNMALAAANSLLSLFRGERPAGLLNPEVQVIRTLKEVKLL